VIGEGEFKMLALIDAHIKSIGFPGGGSLSVTGRLKTGHLRALQNRPL
jgi:hypothetical protein